MRLVPSMRGILLLASLGLLACGDTEPGASPESAVAAFLSAMERSAWDADARQDAFDLLDEQSRQDLEARARRAQSIGRGGLEPWEMLAQGTFRLRFAVRRLEAGQGVVVAIGAGGQRAEIPIVEEAGGWRVVLLAPEAAPEGQ